MITIMAKSQLLNLVALMFTCIVMNSPHGGATTCDDVYDDLFPCLGHILIGGQVPSACCDGINTLINSANTKTDRQQSCSCLKSLASKATDEQVERAESIPKECDATIPFEISRDVDCSKVEVA